MKKELIARTAPFGQDHLLSFWDELSDADRESLARQIDAIDFAGIASLYEHREDPPESLTLADRATDPPAYKFSTVPSGGPDCRARIEVSVSDAIFAGNAALRKRSVGVILVAGGQGTRLGFPHPKGMFPLGPVSQATLFRIHCEKVLAASRRYGYGVPLCIMTSPATHEETVDYLEKNERFGLSPDDVFVFCQGTMPALSLDDGKILMDGKASIARSPDGHGGMLAAISRQENGSSVLERLQQRGIEQFFYFQVDNPLVQICSPEFLGYHLASGSEFTCQVIRKRFPTDRVGNVVQVDDRLYVIEYSDLPESVAKRTNPDGSLQIWAGSIAVHVISAALLDRMSKSRNSLPFHIAKKKVPYIDVQTGELRQPSEPNAIKLERFVFDLLPSARNAVVVEVDIPNHYAPLKNAAGSPSDSPETVQRQLSDLHTDWLRQAGAVVAPNTPIEISPLFADSPEAVKEKVEAETAFDQPTYLS